MFLMLSDVADIAVVTVAVGAAVVIAVVVNVVAVKVIADVAARLLLFFLCVTERVREFLKIGSAPRSLLYNTIQLLIHRSGFCSPLKSRLVPIM